MTLLVILASILTFFLFVACSCSQLCHLHLINPPVIFSSFLPISFSANESYTSFTMKDPGEHMAEQHHYDAIFSIDSRNNE